MIMTEEWSNYSERLYDSKRNFNEKDKAEQLRQWVSYRGQTLSRTGILSERCRTLLICIRSAIANVFSPLLLLVRGMMYYRMALELQCFQEYCENGLYFLSILRTECIDFTVYYVFDFSLF